MDFNTMSSYLETISDFFNIGDEILDFVDNGEKCEPINLTY